MELFAHPRVALVYLPAILFAMIVEGVVYWRKRGHYPWRDSLSSFAIALGHMVAARISHGVIAVGLGLFVWRHRLATIDVGHWYSLALLFLLLEFAYYWYHRAAHRVRLMWGSHSVHHSPSELTLSAAYRLNWTPLLSGSWLFFLPLVWIGFPPAWVFGMVSASLLYQFWLHTTLIPRLGPLEWIFNTPSSHRVHHGSNPDYLDRNYGGVLILFDRLFGTYAAERDDVEIRFGLVHPVVSKNPVVITLHEFYRIAIDVWQARSWYARFGALFAPPGWRPAPASPANAAEAHPGPA